MTFKSLLLFTVRQIYLKIWTKVFTRVKKFDLSQFLNFAFFALSIAQKLAQFSIFAISSATHSQKGKIHNILPLSFLHLREIPFSKFSSKMVRQLRRGSVFKVISPKKTKNTVFWKNNFQNATLSWPFDNFTCKFAQR